MRKSKTTASEIEAIERTEANRVSSRKDGFSIMHIRDRGGVRLSNSVIMDWHVPQDKRELFTPYKSVPENHFTLTLHGETILFDAEEFRKFLRWA